MQPKPTVSTQGTNQPAFVATVGAHECSWNVLAQEEPHRRRRHRHVAYDQHLVDMDGWDRLKRLAFLLN
jgi:hypothetical protein